MPATPSRRVRGRLDRGAARHKGWKPNPLPAGVACLSSQSHSEGSVSLHTHTHTGKRVRVLVHGKETLKTS